MDFIPQPADTKKFGVRWLKWHLYKYPTIFIICLPIPGIIYKGFESLTRRTREMREGTYVPNVLMNRYVVVRPGSYNAEVTPPRYRN